MTIRSTTGDASRPTTAECDASRVVTPDTSHPPGAKRLCAWCTGPIPATARQDAICCSVRCRQARHRFTRTIGPTPQGVAPGRPLRLAYADPPYPGNARLYRGHRDYNGEVDHAALIGRLVVYDGWALSTSAHALPAVLPLCPPGVRVAAWHRGERATASRWPLNAWEPVIYTQARPADPSRHTGTTRRVDSLVHGVSAMTTLRRFRRSHPRHLEGSHMTRHDQLRYALAAVARGWHVFPVTPGDKAPSRGFTDWEHRATTDPATIRRWWSHAPYNIGIACGPSRLVVIDLDKPKPGEHPPPRWALPGVNDGADVLAVRCEQAGQPFPTLETFQVSTRRGGLHLYYTAPDSPRLRNTEGDKGNGLGWLVDTRAHGGYVVGPGSFVDLPDGTGTYAVAYNAVPAPLPPWLFKQLSPRPPAVGKPVRLNLPADRRGKFLHAAITGELELLAAAPEGQRNRTLYMAATALGQLVAGGALAESEVTSLLEQGGVNSGLTASETRITIKSGLKNGARRPRTIAA
ncbi:hypothetical protein Aple_051150 [Acrocarpospora pleiomorpha]|uniref:DNA primase/polymerase bifunctional N-terminal domain-containing protein n=1 Tax=Acrocarpospora pleiomorpha TaxID=90975 RepID=A0A5M3XUX8_9ACTN|nr:bifunctional DNA primase/polymerase [Acrocarpospora pleiomorpha]GES22218.1 hypothetical protein Aple_051150 [Acrocarpospora pleiomorpha]